MADKKKIVVVGSLNMDAVINVENIPRAGETVMGSDVEKVPGGKGANQAYAAGKLGGNVTMLGVVGDDEDGKTLVDSLRQEAGVETQWILRDSDAGTGTAYIYVQSDGNNCIVVSPGANHRCDLKYVKEQEKQLRESDILLTQFEIPIETVAYALKTAKKMGNQVILNPAPAPGILTPELLKYVDILTPNETELEIITGRKWDASLEDLEQMCKLLLDKGVGCVIVTLGEEGCFLAGKEFKHFPAYKAEAVDTTAAGDTFSGALAVMLAEKKTMEEAIEFAMKASAITVQRKGAQLSIPGRTEVEQYG